MRARRHPFLGRRGFKVLRVVVVVVAVALLAALLSLYETLVDGLPDVGRLSLYEPPETSRIFAADGALVGTMFDENRTYVPVKDVHPLMIRALTSVEDSRFFEHSGVDGVGILRAALANLRGGRVEQGASTLTMQLARIHFLNDERTLWRKMQEALLARRIEDRFSKTKILEIYLNEVYFGQGAYGIGAASNLYFRKTPGTLTAAESALLAGLLQAPSELNPFLHPAAARARQEMVLNRMLQTGTLTPHQFQSALKQARAMTFTPPEADSQNGLLKYPYFTTYVIRELSLTLSESRLRRGGLNVYTSLDLRAQRLAEKTVRDMMKAHGGRYGADNAALVLLDNETGHILAMVGGRGYGRRDRFNRAWQAGRQPGSAFKPLVYAAALEGGFSPEADIPDVKVVFHPGTPHQWVPHNFDGRYMGRMPLRTALMLSRNVVAARLMHLVGVQPVVQLARRMGFDGSLPPYPSLALGTGEVTPLEMAGAYAVFARGGGFRRPEPLEVVVGPTGEVVEDRRALPETRVLSATTAAAMTEMLRRVVLRGTGTAAAIQGRWVAGKTGTTESSRDGWFVGYTPRYTLSVWVGNDDDSPTFGMTGGSLPAMIWREYLAALTAADAPDEAPLALQGKPVRATLCRQSHFLATPACKRTYVDGFRTKYVPKRPCPLHPKVKVADGVDPDLLPGASYPVAVPTSDVPSQPAPPEPEEPGATAPDFGGDPYPRGSQSDVPSPPSPPDLEEPGSTDPDFGRAAYPRGFPPGL